MGRSEILKRNILRQAWIIFLYLIISLIMTFPLVLHFNDATLGDTPKDSWGDAAFVLWNVWIFRTSLINFTNPFITNDILYPVGARLFAHEYSPFSCLLVLPVLLFSSNLYLQMNCILIFPFFVLAAYGMYRLCLYLIKNHIAAFIAGLIFSFCPFRMGCLLGHMVIGSVYCLPFYVLFLIKLIREDKDTKNACLAGLLLFFIFSTGFYIFFHAILFTSIYLPLSIFALRNIRKALRKVGLLMLFIFIFYLFYLPFITDVKREKILSSPSYDIGAASSSADLLSFFVPSSPQHFLMRTINNIERKIHSEQDVFPGYVVWLFVFCSLWQCLRKKIRIEVWLFTALIFFVLSLGPFLRVNGVSQTVSIEGINYPFPLPYLHLLYIPFLRNIRAPSRFGIMVIFSFAIISAYVFKNILERRRRPVRILLTGGITTCILLEFLVAPWPLFKPKIPQIYYQIRKESAQIFSERSTTEGFTVLDIPLGMGSGVRGTHYKGGSRSLFYQTIHQKRIIGGGASRLPDWELDYFSQSPIIGTLLHFTETGKIQNQASSEKAFVPQILSLFGIRYIIIHPPYVNSAVHRYIEEVFVGYLEELPEQDGVVAYRVKPVERPSSFAVDFSSPASSLYAIRGLSIYPRLKWAFSDDKETLLLLPLREKRDYRMGFSVCPAAVSHDNRQKIDIVVNNKFLETVHLSTSWQVVNVRIPASFLKAGDNWIKLRYGWVSSAEGLFPDYWIGATGEILKLSAFISSSSCEAVFVLGAEGVSLLRDNKLLVISLDKDNSRIAKENIKTFYLEDKKTSEKFHAFLQCLPEERVVVMLGKNLNPELTSFLKDAVTLIGGRLDAPDKGPYLHLAALGVKSAPAGSASIRVASGGKEALIRKGRMPEDRVAAVVFSSIHFNPA